MRTIKTDILNNLELRVVIQGEERLIRCENLHRLMSSKEEILEFARNYSSKIAISDNGREIVLTFFDESDMWKFFVLCMVKSGLGNSIVLIHLDDGKNNAIIDAVLTMDLVLHKKEILELANQKNIRVFYSNTTTPIFLLDSAEQSKDFLRCLFWEKIL